MKFFDSSKRVGAGLGLGALLAMASSAVSTLPVPWQLNMTPGVTKTSPERLPDLHRGRSTSAA